MKFTFAAAFVFAANLACAASVFASPATETVSPRGEQLAARLDAMGVESKWIAGEHVDWRSGRPDGQPVSATGRHTHCSAFVAAAAEQLGVHILRPPEHGQALLANAQFEWLGEEGAAEGWRPLPDGAAAQAAANAGQLVVATYESHFADKPGHIAIVKPAARSDAEIAAEGPLVIQAGTVNSDAIPLRAGFAGHPTAWGRQEVRYYAHRIATRP
jgi:hypothetical protein